MALFFGEEKHYQSLVNTCAVHVDDVVRAHIHLFEYPEAKGRYICFALNFKIHELHQFLTNRYPQYNITPLDSLKDLKSYKIPSFSSKKLLKPGSSMKMDSKKYTTELSNLARILVFFLLEYISYYIYRIRFTFCL